MRLSFANERVLAVMAHPDDAEILCGGTLARAKKDGAAAGVVVMCQGDKGAGSARQPGNLGAVRQKEAASALQLLDATLFWFGAGDSELFDGYENRKRLMEMYRRFRPTLIIAHWAADYHADHRAASALAEATSWFCASRGHVTESAALDMPPRLWFADTLGMSGFEPHFFVDVSEQVELKRKMLACHASQLERAADQDFAPLDGLMLQQCQARGAQCGVAAAEAFVQHGTFKRAGAW